MIGEPLLGSNMLGASAGSSAPSEEGGLAPSPVQLVIRSLMGSVVENATVRVIALDGEGEPDGFATIYDDDLDAYDQTQSAPVSDENGVVQFWADPGVYNLEVEAEGVTRTHRGYRVGYARSLELSIAAEDLPVVQETPAPTHVTVIQDGRLRRATLAEFKAWLDGA